MRWMGRNCLVMHWNSKLIGGFYFDDGEKLLVYQFSFFYGPCYNTFEGDVLHAVYPRMVACFHHTVSHGQSTS